MKKFNRFLSVCVSQRNRDSRLSQIIIMISIFSRFEKITGKKPKWNFLCFTVKTFCFICSRSTNEMASFVFLYLLENFSFDFNFIIYQNSVIWFFHSLCVCVCGTVEKNELMLREFNEKFFCFCFWNKFVIQLYLIELNQVHREGENTWFDLIFFCFASPTFWMFEFFFFIIFSCNAKLFIYLLIYIWCFCCCKN